MLLLSYLVAFDEMLCHCIAGAEEDLNCTCECSIMQLMLCTGSRYELWLGEGGVRDVGSKRVKRTLTAVVMLCVSNGRVASFA